MKKPEFIRSEIGVGISDESIGSFFETHKAELHWTVECAKLRPKICGHFLHFNKMRKTKLSMHCTENLYQGSIFKAPY